LGRRKRKKVVYRRVRSLPKVFTCPKCGHKTVKAKVTSKEDDVEVICGHCGVSQKVEKNALTEPVDAFGSFIDIYYKDQEYARLTNREEKLWEKKQFTELTLVYSFLADNANVNAKKALEEYEKNKDPDDLEQAEKWKATAAKYVENEIRLKEQLDSGVIEDAALENDLYEESEDNPYDEGESKISEKPKRRAKIEEILGDTGFLEF
jgi:transcription elongation factor Elf1